MKRTVWAGVVFCAQGGRIEDLLAAAAANAIKLRAVRPCPGGFTARCAAGRYRALSRLASRYRVRLRVQRRTGLYFPLRPLLRRGGLWLGLAAAGALLLGSSRMIWHIEYVGLTRGGQARAAAILRQMEIREGAFAEGALLTAGETALVEQDAEISWASLNFTGGRLTVETAMADPVPEIRPTRLTDITAKAAGTIVAMEVAAGQPAVAVGQTVAAGQTLITAYRLDREGLPVMGSAAGTVTARMQWSTSKSQPLYYEAEVADGRVWSRWTLSAAGRSWTLPCLHPDDGQPVRMTQRHYGLQLLGLTLPVAVEETVMVPCESRTVQITESLALAKARLAALRELAAAWPDAAIETVQEQTAYEDGVLQYQVTFRITADICQ